MYHDIYAKKIIIRAENEACKNTHIRTKLNKTTL